EGEQPGVSERQVQSDDGQEVAGRLLQLRQPVVVDRDIHDPAAGQMDLGSDQQSHDEQEHAGREPSPGPLHACCLPNRPWGRRISVSMRRPRSTAPDAPADRRCDTRVSENPRNSPPTSAPRNEPSPPSTAAMNPFSPSWRPTYTTAYVMGPARIPARPPMAPARANDRVINRRTGIPDSRAPTG